MSEYSGILVVDKPAGWTSHDVVSKTRNMLAKVKVGHTGTLDPFATGVLILLIGTATKKAYLFTDDRKSYDAQITFGYATDTYDCTGTITETGDPGSISITDIEQVIEGFKGDSMQSPPPYSAVKVNGKRLYKLARKGHIVKAEPRPITIFDMSFSLAAFPVVKLSLTCSKGTYIRSIAHDIGLKTGCPAHLSALRRTQAGRFTISDAIDFNNVVTTGDSSLLSDHIIPVPEKPFI